MKIVNYNDYIRKYIYDESEHANSSECKALYKKIKANDEMSKIIAGVLYECAYLSCLTTLKFHPDDEQELENMEFLHEMCDIEDFICAMDKEMFDDFCNDLIYFHTIDFYTKRRMLSYVLEDNEYLKKAYPCFIMDLLFYLNKYDASILLEQYYERLYKKDKTPFLNTVKAGVKEIFQLEEQDFFTYKYIILDMIESFYKYNKYMIGNNIIVHDGILEIIEQINNDIDSFIYLWAKDRSVLKLLIEGYIKYNILEVEDISNIENYFKEEKNNKEITKILKKCNKLKEEK